MTSHIDSIINAIKENGPITRSEMEDYLNIEKRLLAATITRLMRSHPRINKRIYIANYVYDDAKLRYYPRPVYDLGDKPDAKKPVRNDNLTKKRYLNKLNAKFKFNNVFNLGITRDAIRELRKAA